MMKRPALWYVLAGCFVVLASCVVITIGTEGWNILFLALGCFIRGAVLRSNARIASLVKTGQNLDIARETFGRIQETFPHLSMRVHTDYPVDLSMDIPEQPGLKFDVHLDLQNLDELTLTVGGFWVGWFPCTKSEIVERYIDAVRGFLAGKYRILEHYRGNRVIRAELQRPSSEGWRTVATSSHGLLPWSFQKKVRELVNTPNNP